MANTVNVRTVIDGPKKAIFHVFLASDGVTGELSDQVIVDVSTLTPAPSLVSVLSVDGHLSGFTGTLEFDATADVPFLVMPNGEEFHACFESFGGLKDNSGAGTTGDIVLTTSGFTASGDTGWFVITVEKD